MNCAKEVQAYYDCLKEHSLTALVNCKKVFDALDDCSALHTTEDHFNKATIEYISEKKKNLTEKSTSKQTKSWKIGSIVID